MWWVREEAGSETHTHKLCLHLSAMCRCEPEHVAGAGLEEEEEWYHTRILPSRPPKTKFPLVLP